jgi:hypothetical protein
MLNTKIDSTADIPDLRIRIQTRLNDHYQLGTITGKLYLFFYALYHCTTPSAFLAQQLDQDLKFYVSNVSKFRSGLVQFEARRKAGRMPEDVGIRFTDGTSVNLRLQCTGSRVDSLCVKDDRTGNWEVLGLLPEQYLEKIEKDILHNPDLFDPRLVASCALRPAFENIEALQQSICKQKMEAARRAGLFNQEEFHPGGSDDFQILLTNPANVHGRFFIEHIEDIAENLIRSGFYGALHPDEARFKEFQLCSLHIAILDFISQNLDHLLLGTGSGTTTALTQSKRLLLLLPVSALPDVIIDKLTRLEHSYPAWPAFVLRN